MLRIAFLAAVIAIPGAATVAAPDLPAAREKCAVTAPADADPGVTTWLGACRGGKAQGLGVMRIQREFDWSLFLGRMADGRPVSGAWYLRPLSPIALVRLDYSGHPISGEDEATNTAAFALGAAAADSAADRFFAAGNERSRDFYRRLAATLRVANSATGYDAGTVAAHAAALKDMRAVLVGRGSLDGRAILRVQPSGHCGTVLGWAGGSMRIDWQGQGNETFTAEGLNVRFPINNNQSLPAILRFPAGATSVRRSIGSMLWACAPE